MKKVMITGCAGLLGQYLCKNFANKYEIVGVFNQTQPQLPDIILHKADLSKIIEFKKALDQHKPDIIINTAGLTSVDECESNPQLANQLNTLIPKNLVTCLENSSCKIIHISTDHLFSGEKSNYTETSEVKPINNYAKTKLEGECEILQNKQALVLRTNFYGGHTSQKMSFSTWIHSELKKGNYINLFDDVFFTPISVCGFGENLHLLLNSNLNGIYNFVGNERISKYEFAHKLADTFSLPKKFIIKSKLAHLNLKAHRPKEMSLNIDKIKKDLPTFISEDIDSGLSKIKEFQIF